MGKLARNTCRTPPLQDDPPFQYIDKSLAIIGRTFESHNVRLEQEFVGQRLFLATQFESVNERFRKLENSTRTQFENVDGRIQKLEESTTTQFEKIHKQFGEIHKQFEEVNKRVDNVDERVTARLRQIENASRNFLRTRGWEQIAPVGILTPSGELSIPIGFPRTVREFWDLKEPGNRPRLVRLSRFYGLRWNTEWSADEESNDGYDDNTEDDTAKSGNSQDASSTTSDGPMPLEDAVQQHPRIAHRALASSLGLSYDGIEAFMRRAREMREGKIKASAKRKQQEDSSDKSNKRKTRAPLLEDLTNVTSPSGHVSSPGKS
ncbi:MAG: hypothetical protein Q9178_007996 [Gyalolechia marmorata]